ncbi:MAG: hypothetical protein NW223_06330 [Hyphomicrobiaceae bacterium]|nr:hypothetical protein [Hyphomicrobiaceae bacterium]
MPLGISPAQPPRAVNEMLVRVLKNFSSQLLSLIVSFADRFVLAAILLRAWQTELYADWSTILAVTGLLGLADLGLSTLLSNRLHKAAATGREELFRRTLSVGMFAYASAAVLMLAATLGLAAVAAHGTFPVLRALASGEGAALVVLLGIAQTLHTTRSSISQVYRGRGHYARGILVDGLAALGITGSLVVAGLLGGGPIALGLVLVCAQAVFGWGLMAFDLRRFAGLKLRPLAPQAGELRQGARAMRWYSLGYALPLLWLNAPVIILGSVGLSGAVLVAFLLHRTLVNFCRTFAVMISTSAGVEIARSVFIGDHAHVRQRLERVGVASGVVNGAMVGGMLTFGAPLIHLWSGGASALDMATLLWLALPAVALAPMSPLYYLASLSDMPKPLAISQAVQVGVAMGLALALVRRHGASGVAFALAAGELLATGVLLPLWLDRLLGIRVWGSVLRVLARTLASLAAAGLVGWLVTRIAPIHGALSLLCAGAAWAMLVLPVLAFLATSRGQRQAAVRLARAGAAEAYRKLRTT